ncbi:MAG: rod shape-determining protein MreD [Chloroflexota bacterium]|nr:rod shape-determining protein MreD [Chloroflexota bacterium]
MVVLVIVAVFVELCFSLLIVDLPHPMLVLLLAISAGMVRRPRDGAVVAFGGGFLLDVFGGPPLGRQTLALVVGTLTVFLARTELARRTVLAPVLAAVVGTVLYWLVLAIVESTAGLVVPWSHIVLRWVLPTIALNALLVLPLIGLVERLSVRSGARRTIHR